jgi:hypothetical protein
MESVCIIPDSALCKLQINTIQGQVEWEIRDGKTSVCDPTNVPPDSVCSERMESCFGVSIFPRCVFMSAYSRQDLINMPKAIYHPRKPEPHL